MPALATVPYANYLDAFAPPALAEEWDNVGLLAGDPGGRSGSRHDVPDDHPGQCARSGGSGMPT